MRDEAFFGALEGRGMSIALRVSALLCIVIGVVLWAGPALLRVDLFDDDAAQHVYWLYRYMDPALFPGDASVQYFRTSAPLGYRAFYSLVAAHFDALAAAEWLSVGLFLVTSWFAWGFATSIPGPARELRGLAAVVAVIGFIVATHTSGGIMWVMAFQRTLALPLILGCMWALQNGRYLWVGVTWLVAGLVYPVVLPVLGIAAGAVFLRELVLQRHMPRWWLANVLLAALAIAAALYGLPHADNLLPDYTYEQAKTMPEFGTSGRLALYTTSTLTNIFRYHMTGLGWPPLPLAALAIAALLARFSPQRRLVSFEAWIVLFAGVGLWGAMRVFPDELMFGLYVPNRHARWAIAAFGVAAVPAGVCALLGLLVREVERGRDRFASWAGYAAIVAAPLLVAALLLPDARAQWHAPVDQDLENTYAYLATLPKDVIIGAHPDLASYIPLRAKRSVLSSSEASMPWKAGYYAIMKPRIEALLRAAFAPDMRTVDREMAPFGVSVFVTCPMVWQHTSYFVPYDAMLQELLERGRRAGFALKAPPRERVLFRSGECYVLSVRKP